MSSFLVLIHFGVLMLLGISNSAAKITDTLALTEKEVRRDPISARLSAGQSEITIRSEAWHGRAFSLPDILAEQTGIETRRYGGLGTFQTVSIRGAMGSRLLVYLDGIPLNSAGGGAVDLGKINLDGLDRIEIRKGMALASEGGNGMGGVVHLYSKSRQRNAEMTVGAGRFGLKRSALNLGVSNPNVSLIGNVGLVRIKNDFQYLDRNHTAYNLEDDKWVSRKNSAYKSLDALAQTRFQISPKQSLRFKMATSQNSGGLPGDESAVTSTAGFSNTLHQYLLGWEKFGASDQNQIASEISLDEDTPEFHWTKADPIGLSLGSDTTLIKNRSVRSQLRVHGKYSWPLSSLSTMWNIGSTFLMALGQENLKPVLEDNNSTRKNLRRNGTLAADFSVGRDAFFQLTLGANSEWILDRTQATLNYLGDSLPGLEKSEWHSAGRLGALWMARPKLSLFFNIGKFYHLPSLGDRFGGRWGLVPNPRLKEERGVNFEVGMRKSWNQNFLEICAFRNQIEDAILYIHSLNLVKATNLDATLNQGLEVTVDQALPLGLSTTFNSTLLLSENQSQTYYSGFTLPDAPTYHQHLKIRAPFLRHFVLEQAWEFRSEIFRDPGNMQRIPEQNLFHTTLRWTPNKRLQVDASLQNLTNIYYEDAYAAFPYPGRNFGLTFTAKL